MPMLWIQSRVDYTLNLPQILSKRQLSNSKHSQPFINLQTVWILQSLNTLGSTISLEFLLCGVGSLEKFEEDFSFFNLFLSFQDVL